MGQTLHENESLVSNSGFFGFFAHFKHAHNRRRIHGLAINVKEGSGDVMSTICLLSIFVNDTFLIFVFLRLKNEDDAT